MKSHSYKKEKNIKEYYKIIYIKYSLHECDFI